MNAEEKDMRRYGCTVCSYVYDPAVGDPGHGVAPGTPFPELPEDWRCPRCGATKDQFRPERKPRFPAGQGGNHAG